LSGVIGLRNAVEDDDFPSSLNVRPSLLLHIELRESELEAVAAPAAAATEVGGTIPVETEPLNVLCMRPLELVAFCCCCCCWWWYNIDLLLCLSINPLFTPSLCIRK
jgi:hypothetical protein